MPRRQRPDDADGPITSGPGPWTAGAAPRWPRRLRGLGVGLALVALAITLIQPLRVRAVAAATMADALGLPVPRLLATSVDVGEQAIAGTTGDLYDPGGTSPAVVLIPGAAPRGRDDPRVRQLAHAVARSGRAVFVPELAVYDQQLVVEDVERLVLVTHALGGPDRGPAVVLGTSFGGSLGLLAAADTRLQGRVAKIAVFGSFVDLLGVVQATATGSSLVAGERIAWDPHPRAEEIVRERLLELLDAPERTAVLEALGGEADPGELDRPSRAAYDLLTHTDPARTFDIADRLPRRVRERIAEVSPSSVADGIRAPVVAMHSTDDPAMPYGELERLGELLPQARLLTLDSFEHVDLELDSPRELPRVGADLLAAWRFATEVLSAQEGWLPRSRW
jgi:pimeloyl-ACP methyl ester carboxylesterase